jgi:hypothetical protein
MPILDPRIGNTLSRLRHRIMPTMAQKREGEPLSRVFGLDRGQPIDRMWIESFLARHGAPISGKAVEVGGTHYARRFYPNCTAYCLRLSDNGSPNCVVCDLEAGDKGLMETFDVFVATQVFNFIFETRAALRHTASMLKPEGFLVGSVAAITQVSRYDADRWGHFFSFTRPAWERLLEEVFEEVRVESYGNVDVACAFLNGLSVEDVPPSLLEYHDPDYPVVLCFKASRPRRLAV